MTAPAATTLYENGTILTLDHAQHRHAALVVKDGCIAGLGTDEDMRALAGPDAARVDLAGATLLPGIIDAHPHAMHFAAPGVGAVDLLDAGSFDDIVTRIRARAAVTPPGQWIVCTPIGEPHYFIRRDYTALSERRMPDRQVLDRASTAHPIWIMAWAPRTPNVCAFNSLALARLGLGAQAADRVCDVWIEKEEGGHPSGILRGKVNNYYGDDPYWHALSAQLPRLPDALWELAGIAGVQSMNAMGVTGLYEAHAMVPPHLDAYEKIAAAGLCTARVTMSLELSSYAFSTMHYGEDEVWALLALGQARQRRDHPRVQTVGVTLSRGGPLSQGYLRMNMVLGGYRDVDEFLCTVGECASPAQLRERQWVMQHCYFVAPGHVAAFAAHGFQVTTSASFVYGKADRVREKFSPAVAADFIAMRRLWDAGVTLACGSDWGPDSPWRQMALNETREGAASGHHHLESGQALTRLESLQAFTRNAATVMQRAEIGRLIPGALADLVIVDRDPLTVDAAALAETRVLRTIVDGQAVFDSGALVGGPLALPPPAAQLIAQAMQPPA